MKAGWRAQSARPREMSLANLLREAKGGACPPLSRSYASAQKEGALADSQYDARFFTFVPNDKRRCHFDRREKFLAPGIIESPRIIE